MALMTEPELRIVSFGPRDVLESVRAFTLCTPSRCYADESVVLCVEETPHGGEAVWSTAALVSAAVVLVMLVDAWERPARE